VPSSCSNRGQQIPEIYFLKTAFRKRLIQIGKNRFVQLLMLVQEFDIVTIRKSGTQSAFNVIIALFLLFIDRHFWREIPGPRYPSTGIAYCDGIPSQYGIPSQFDLAGNPSCDNVRPISKSQVHTYTCKS
jgi:hypothetical protein